LLRSHYPLGALLWLGDALGRGAFTSYEDLGIEVAPDGSGKWFCWLRSDAAHRYRRFIHIRHIETVGELTALIAALTGQPWNPEHVWSGCFVTPEHAAWMRKEHDRIDQKLMREGASWRDAERDETMCGPLSEHVDAFLKAGSAK
jgi:hypothetical protein